MFTWVILKGFLLGIGAAAPIGPVNVEIARRTLRGGFRCGLALGCGAVTVDVGYAILTALSLGPLLQRQTVRLALGIGGTVLLACLGILCLRSAWRGSAADGADGSAHRAGLASHYATGLLMTALNPMTLGFWLVAVPSLVGNTSAGASRFLPMLCAGVFLGTFGWVCFFAGTLAVLRRNLGSRFRFAADMAGGVILLAFAAMAGWRVLSSGL